MKRIEATPDPTEKLPPAVIVHDLSMARAAMAAGLPVTLLSAPGAALYAGVGWWRALVRAAAGSSTVADILDCGDAPGRTLEALRAGQRRLLLQAPEPEWADMADRAARCGALLLSNAPDALDLARPGANCLLAGWLAGPLDGRSLP